MEEEIEGEGKVIGKDGEVRSQGEEETKVRGQQHFLMCIK